MADRYAVGALWNSTAGWSTTSGGSSGASIPTSSDAVIFDINSISMSIDANANCLSLNSTGYTATLTQSGSYTLTVASGTFIWAAGTFVGGSGAITCSGDVTISGGTFTATSGTWAINANFTISGGTFSHNNGIVQMREHLKTLNTGTRELYTLEFNSSSPANQHYVSGTVIINGDLKLMALGGLNNGAIELKSGNLISTDADGFTASTVAKFTKVGTQYINPAGQVGYIPAIEVATSGNTTDASSSGAIRCGNVTITNGTYLAPASLTVDGSFTVSGSGVFTHNNGTVTLVRHTSVCNIGTEDLYNLTITTDFPGDQLTFSGTVLVNGTLSFTRYNKLNGGTIECKGNIIASNSFYDWSMGSTVIKLTAAGGQSINAGGQSGCLPVVTIDNGGATVTAAASGTLYTNDFTITSGTFIAPAGILSIYGNFTATAGVYTHNGGTLTFTGHNHTLNAGSNELYSLAISASQPGNILTISGTLVLRGNMSITQIATLNGGTVELYGNLSSTDTSHNGALAITFKGSANQTVTGGTGQFPEGNWIVNKTGGSVILAANLTLTGTGKDFTVTAGTLDLAGYNLTVPDILTITDKLKLKGTETITAGTLSISSTTSTVIFYGTGTAVMDLLTKTYFNLTLGASKTHEVTTGAGNQIEVKGAFASDGTSSTRSILRALADAASDWYLKLSGTSALTDKVNVKRSNAAAGSTVNAPGSVNSGNNTNWAFSAIKTINGLAQASVKTRDGLAIASVKTLNGVAN